MGAQIKDMRVEVGEGTSKDLRGDEMGELRERMAHLEGLLEGLREAITVRVSGQLGTRAAMRRTTMTVGVVILLGSSPGCTGPRTDCHRRVLSELQGQMS